MEFIKKNQQYKEVSYSEREEEEYLSSTEVESQHDADEKQSNMTKTKTQRPRRSRPRRSRTSLFVAEFRRFRWLVDVVLLTVNITLSVVLLLNFNQENTTSTAQVGSSFDRTGPDCEDITPRNGCDESLTRSSPDQGRKVQCGPGLRAQRHDRVLLRRDAGKMEYHDARYFFFVPSL
jgi:hypothetical protein